MIDTLTLTLPDLSRPQKVQGDAYLRLQLDTQVSAVLPLGYVQEVLVLASQNLTPIPNMPTCVLGLLNRRSRVFWLVDLARMVGLPPLDPSVAQHNIIVVRVGSAPLALSIQEVKGVVRFPADSTQSADGLIDAALVPYLRGCILQLSENLLVLDAEAIVRSPDLQGH